MKGVIAIFTFFFSVSFSSYSQVAINTTGTSPDASAMLDVASTTHGILLPRVTTAQRVSIDPDTGLMVYDTDFESFWVFNGYVWNNLSLTGRVNIPFLVKGEVYNDGILFYQYHDSNGREHGLLMDTLIYDNVKWAVNTGHDVVGSYSTWDGTTNTDYIYTDIFYNGNVYPVFDSVVSNGAYIPSIGEMLALFNNRYLVNRTLNRMGLPEMHFDDDFWTSTQKDNNEAFIFKGYRMFWATEGKGSSNSAVGINKF